MKKQHDINERMRSILLDWLIGVHKRFKLKENTLFFAINYLDRFLGIKEVKRGEFQLVGTSALFIAAKYEDVYPPDIKDFVFVTDKSCTKLEIVAMESLILKTLDYSLTVVTPNILLSHLWSHFNGNNKTIYLLASYFLELSLVEYEMIKYKPSLQASSSLCLARRIVKNIPIWDDFIVKYTGYNENDIEECVNDMLKLCKEIGCSRFQSIREKYSTVYKMTLPKILV